VKEFEIPPMLSARETEVLYDQVMLSVEEGLSSFRFKLAPNFLPSIAWLDHLRVILSHLVKKKSAVEIVCYASQQKSLVHAGFHLIADLVVAGTQNARSASPE
jgi:hypothetical protein